MARRAIVALLLAGVLLDARAARAATGEEAPPAPAAPSGDEETPGRRGDWYAGDWYAGAWLGHGGGVVQRRDGSTGFAATVLMVPLSAGFFIGLPASERLLLGAEWGGLFGPTCFVDSMNSEARSCNRSVLLQHVLAMATFFPRGGGTPEAAPAGIFVRGGAGWARLDSWPAEWSSSGVKPARDDPAVEEWSRTGAGALAGVGYARRFRGTRTFDLGLDVAWHWYGGSASQPVHAFSSVLHLGITFH